MMKQSRWRTVVMVVVLCGALLGSIWIGTPPAIEARGGTWTVRVWNNPDMAGGETWTGTSPGVSYSWGAGAPVINGIVTGAPVDNFSVEFTTTTLFTAGNYRFTVQVDDGVRLYVDGLLLINSWQSGIGLRTLQADYSFPTDGTHTIKVQMFESIGDATIVASWAVAVGTLPTLTPTYIGAPWYAEFYNGLDLGGPQIFTTSYPPSGLNLNWGLGSPGGTVPVDNFSARIVRTLTVPSDLPQGVYTVYVRADDNYRFWVDTTIILDRWDTFSGGETATSEVTLLNGSHTLKLEYREREVDANIFLTWTPPNAQDPVLNPDGSGGAPQTGTGGPSTGSGGGGGVVAPAPVPAVTATVTANKLNVRSAPATTAQVVTQINKGETYPVTGRTADNTWAQITVSGQGGWVSSQYVTFSGDINVVPVVAGAAPAAPPPPSGIRGVTLGNLRIRGGPGARNPQIGLMPWGTEIDILGIDYARTWFQVNYAGTVGWSYAPWIRIIQGDDRALPYTDGSGQPNEPPPATEGVILQAFGNVRIRSAPSFTAERIARAIWGTRVQALARSADTRWYKIRYGDIVGWTYALWYRPVQGDVTSLPIE